MIRKTAMRSRLAAAVVFGALTFATPHALANDTVALKNALYGAGYEITNVSPEMDEATRSALTEFQRDQGLEASGELDDATKEALGMVSVQVASSGSAGSQNAGESASAASEPEESQEDARAEEDDVEEDDDGGWSFF